MHCVWYLIHLLRNLLLLAANHNFVISARHVPGVNSFADSLFRFHMQVFHALAPPASRLPPTHPHPPLTTLTKDMRLYLSLALSTRASYNSATRSFISFALTYHRLHQDGRLLPASEETLMLFITYLSYTLKPQSIKVYLSAICREYGLPNPLAETTQLRRLLRGIKRIHGCSTDSRLPITPNLLRSFLHFLDFRYPDHITLWAAMLVAFFGFLRSNELLALQHNDLQRTPEGYLLRIRSSKTDPFRSGATVSFTPSGNDGLCAVTALHLLRAKTSFDAGPLFRFLSGAALTHHKLNHLIQELAARSGVSPGRYSSHSFRIGAASTAAAAGIPDWKIQALGRWSSDCYKRYIRLPNTETNTIAATMAQTHL